MSPTSEAKKPLGDGAQEQKIDRDKDHQRRQIKNSVSLHVAFRRFLVRTSCVRIGLAKVANAVRQRTQPATSELTA
jgi:hypothetical protein